MTPEYHRTQTAIRWWLFKQLSALGWWICPEPQRSELQSAMPSWEDCRRVFELHRRERQREDREPKEERDG